MGVAFWNRCVDKDNAPGEDEVPVLGIAYECLIRAFIRNSEDQKNYMERLKTFAATLKFFVGYVRKKENEH